MYVREGCVYVSCALPGEAAIAETQRAQQQQQTNAAAVAAAASRTRHEKTARVRGKFEGGCRIKSNYFVELFFVVVLGSTVLCSTKLVRNVC